MNLRLLALLLLLPANVAAAAEVAVIAHRAASGYLPEHTLAAVAMAHAMGAHYIEQDVVLTKDDHPIVLHDIHLDTVTDVAVRFPSRVRDDGRFYALDFTLAEIQSLRVHERIDARTRKPVFPDRYPVSSAILRIPTLGEELSLIQGMNRSRVMNVGVYPEIKNPDWHQRHDKDISRIVLAELDRYGYRSKQDNAYLQCFDAAELQRIRRELKCQLKLVQLIGDDRGESQQYQRMRTPEGLRRISEYADGVGPELGHVVTGRTNDGKPIVTSLVKHAHENNLVVHPYTFRSDSLPEHAENWKQLLRWFVADANVDGLFTDFPDRTREVLDELPK